MRFYFISLLVIAIDQVSKIVVRLSMDEGQTIVIWDNILDFIRYENSGIAGGMLQGYGRLFVPVALFVVAIVMHYRRKGLMQRGVTQVGAALLVGGAIGNAIDRLVYNQVTDFIAFQFRDGILNLADQAIMWGGILLVIGMLFDEARSNRRAKARKMGQE